MSGGAARWCRRWGFRCLVLGTTSGLLLAAVLIVWLHSQDVTDARERFVNTAPCSLSKIFICFFSDHFHCPRHNHRKLCISLTSQLVRNHAMRHAPFTGALTSSTAATTTRSTFPFTFRKYPTSGERTANRCCSTSRESSAKLSRFANNRP